MENTWGSCQRRSFECHRERATPQAFVAYIHDGKSYYILIAANDEDKDVIFIFLIQVHRPRESYPEVPWMSGQDAPWLGGGANGSYKGTTVTEKHSPVETAPALGVFSARAGLMCELDHWFWRVPGPCVPRILKMCVCFNPAILFLGNKDVAIGKLSVRLLITARGTAGFGGSWSLHMERAPMTKRRQNRDYKIARPFLGIRRGPEDVKGPAAKASRASLDLAQL